MSEIIKARRPEYIAQEIMKVMVIISRGL